MDEIIKEFVQESTENLDRLDQDFLKLESDPGNLELLKTIFRAVHTVKGTCGFLGFTKLEALAHAGENLLSLLREGELRLTPAIADALLEMVDAIRGYLREINSTESEGDADPTALITKLNQLLKTASPGPAAATSSQQTELESNANSQAASVAPETPTTLPALKEPPSPEISAEARPKAEETKEAAIRVDVNLLEKQMNLVSELVLLRNRLLQLAADANERNLNATVHGLNYVTSELRKNVMKTRMQPVSQLFDKLPRIIRDVSRDMGKKVRLETQGGDTELDKTLLEAIKDPVTHILRNSIDHGIEAPELRHSHGKPEEGTVSVRAFHEGGNFHLEITDDGAGIDSERVKQKAVSKGLITAAAIEKMSEAEVLNLIFLPGLSTAEKVTNVSGRGVGMDVVKTNIERIGGRAKLESKKNQGTTLLLEIPLTLATIPALTVVSGNSVFAIPQAALVEMVALDTQGAEKVIESIDGVSVFRFRGMVVPLLSLRDELKLTDVPQRDADIIKLVVVRTEGRQIALQVDTIRNTEEIVIKPLDKRFKSIALFSGATVLGDGRVALILDIPSFVRRAGVVLNRELRIDRAVEVSQREKVSLLLLAGPDGERMAIPLDFVQRLEEFEPSAKEPMGELTVVQYRNEILPITPLADLLDERRTRRRTEEGRNAALGEEKIQAVVLRLGGCRAVILEVHRILGIVKMEIKNLTAPSRPGVRGSLVIQERVTELLDIEALLAHCRQSDMASANLVGAGAGN
jgi:two-component system chemotaxis sensor kinase CheA